MSEAAFIYVQCEDFLFESREERGVLFLIVFIFLLRHGSCL